MASPAPSPAAFTGFPYGGMALASAPCSPSSFYFPSGYSSPAGSNGSSSPSGYYGYTQPAASPSGYYQAGAVASTEAMYAGALVLYGANAFTHPQVSSLLGMYYDDKVHGPLASGTTNPFAPGLPPTASAPTSRPVYDVEDPLKQRFPAARNSTDPLNWITENLFDVRTRAEEAAQKRVPLKSLSARS